LLVNKLQVIDCVLVIVLRAWCIHPRLFCLNHALNTDQVEVLLFLAEFSIFIKLLLTFLKPLVRLKETNLHFFSS